MLRPLLATALATFCFAAPSTAWADPTAIVLSVAPGTFTPMYQEVADAFMKQHPEIKVTVRSNLTYPEQTQEILREALTGGLPDVANIAYNQIQLLADRGLAAPLAPFIAKETDWDKRGYSPSITAMGSAGDVFYAMPFWSSFPVVFYNNDLVKAAGGDIDHLPSDWQGLMALSDKINKLGNGNIGLFDIYLNAGWPFEALVLGNGGKILDDQNKVGFNTPAGLAALQTLHDLGASGMVDMTNDQGRQAFGSGTLGMLVDASSLFIQLKKGAAERFGITIKPMPIPAANGSLPVGGNAIMILAKDPQKQAAAWEYAKFASGPEGQAIMTRNTGAVPINGFALPLLADFYAQNPEPGALVKQLPPLAGWYAFPGPNGNKAVGVIENYLQRVMHQTLAPADALAGITQDVNALLALQ